MSNRCSGPTCEAPLAPGHTFCSDTCEREAADAERNAAAAAADRECTCGDSMRPGAYDPNCPIDGEVTEEDHGPGCDGPLNCTCPEPPHQVETVEEAMRQLPDHLLEWIAHRSQHAGADLPTVAAAELVRRHGCPWTTWAECALARERAVAGTATPPATCDVHGDPELDDVAEVDPRERPWWMPV